MTQTSKLSLPAMLEMRQSGAEFKDIANAAGLKPMTAYQRMRRTFGCDAIRPVPEAANDNHPDRITKMMPHNGGCSTTSGKMPVSVQRVPVAANDNEDDTTAGLAVNEYALRQVAA